MINPKYNITNEILKNISQIEAAKQIIDNSPMLPYYERKFKNEAVARAVHHSTHIEGNSLDFKDAEKVVKGQVIDKSATKERDLQDIINYRNVLNYIDKIQETRLTVSHTLRVHKEISHNLLPPKYCGKFRDKQVVIRNTKTKQISYVPPSYLEVKLEIKDLTNWLKKEGDSIHPVIKAGLFHCQFARIHPFVDGNGRTARALTTLLLYLDGYDIKKFFCLDEYYDQDLQKYYQALQSINEVENDYTKWLEYFTDGLLKEFIKIKEKVLKISKDQKIKKSIGQVYLSPRQEKIVEYLQEVGRLQNQDFYKVLSEVSEDTVLRDLKDLKKKKVVCKKGKTKAAYYELKN